MGQKTSDDYLKAVKVWYDEHRAELHDGLLIEPSNAGLRDLCLSLLRNGLPVSDEKVFRDFFKTAETEDLRKIIAKFDIERFRSVSNFLRGISQTTDVRNLNLIAVIIEFPYRPLPKFLQQTDSNAELRIKAENFVEGMLSPQTGENIRTKSKLKVILPLAIGLIGVVVAVQLVFNGSPDGCMVWQNDHYIPISCLDTTFDRKAVEPIHRKQIKLRKISVSNQTVFFINGQPQVWYLKSKNRYEFFDRPGYHPVKKEKMLNPVTSYIAMKVVAGEIETD